MGGHISFHCRAMASQSLILSSFPRRGEALRRLHSGKQGTCLPVCYFKSFQKRILHVLAGHAFQALSITHSRKLEGNSPTVSSKSLLLPFKPFRSFFFFFLPFRSYLDPQQKQKIHAHHDLANVKFLKLLLGFSYFYILLQDNLIPVFSKSIFCPKFFVDGDFVILSIPSDTSWWYISTQQ